MTDKADAAGPTAASSNRIRTIVECAAAIALIAIGAQITIPLGFLKFTLQVLVVMLVALVFRPVPALVTMVCYILLGAVGVPVFSWSGAPGLARLVGPFGGYLFSYILAAPLGSIVRRAICAPKDRAANKRRGVVADVVCLVVVALVIYAVETVYFVAIGAPGAPAEGVIGVLMFTTIPYIPAEAVKGVAAFFIARALRRAIPSFAER
jgi:biotin transport system substrate-specific component